MEKTSTFKKNLQKALLLPFVLLGLMMSQLATAHNVTSYGSTCATGPVYKVTPVVNSVNSGTNYAWQYKNSSGNWVCIVNGNNTINGNNYSVSGATSTATTTPSPIVFNNPNSALQGLVIRCVMSDGTGVNPCSMPTNNTYNSGTSSVNFTIAVNNTPCAPSNVLQLGNRVWYDTDNSGINNSENGIANVTVHLYKDDNNDNNADGAFIATDVTDDDGYYMFSNLAPGNYIVGVVTPAGYMSSSINGGDPDNDINFDDNGQVTVGNETRGLAITLALGTEPDGTNTNTNNNITYDFGFLPDCSCTTSGNNMLANPSFENGTTGWSAVGGGVSFTTGTGYVACGTKNGFNDANGTGTAYVYQEFASSPGIAYTFKGFAGTHTGGLGCNPRLIMTFRRADGTNIVQYDVAVTRDVDKNHNQLEQYTVTGTAPAGTVSMRVHGAIDCNTLKMDAFCLTSTNSNLLQLGTRVWYDTNNDGFDNNGEDGIANTIVHLYKDDNNDNVADGAFIATDTTDANGYYLFSNLVAGNYIVGVVKPAGYMPSSVNGGDPDNNINYDNNGIVTVGNEIRGYAITLAPGTEPSDASNPNTNFNPTYDFGLLPDCNCTTSSSNLLTNGSFEDGTTGWSAENGTLTTGTGYIACGAANGFNNASGSGISYVAQILPATAGVAYTFKGFAGVHTAGLSCSPKLILTFRNSAGSNIGYYEIPVTRDVDVNHNQLEQYSITATAPAGTVTVKVHSAINCNTMKIDAFCLTASCTTPATPVATVTQPTCSVATGTIVLSNLPSGSWTINGTANGTPFTLNGAGTNYTQNNVNPGTYVYSVTISGGCTSAPVTTVVNNQPATPTAPAIGTITQPTCSVPTGSIVLNGLPATGNWTITRTTVGSSATTTYSGTGTSLTINSLATGTYTFTVTNSDGCVSPSSNQAVVNGQPATPTAPVATVATQPTCTVSTGSINLSGLPTTGTYTLYQKKNSTTTTLTTTGNTATYAVPNLAPATYTFYVMNNNGSCMSVASNTVTINAQPTPPPAPVATVTQSACNSTGTYTVKLSGLPATGNWIITRTGPGTTTGNGTITSTGTSTVISGLAAGAYTFTVTNADGCISAATPVTLAQQTANAVLGGKTWDDKNRDGMFTSGETVITNVAVSLFMDANGDGIGEGAPMKVANTNSNGTYSFTNLCPGNYVVGFGNSDGFVRTKQPNTVSADAGDSDPDPNTGYTPTINLVAGQTDNTNDAGYYAPTILPVGFGNITAQARNCEVVLSFEVLTQKNTKQFEILYSKDGANWNNIGIVSAKASSTTAYTYNFTHTQPAAGVNLYRIRVVDTDNKISYSQVVSATSVCAGKGMITTYPNPAYDMLNVSLPSTYQDAQLQLFNGTGQMVISDTRKSGLIRSLNTQNLAPGMYLLKVIYNNNVVMTQKVVKGE